LDFGQEIWLGKTTTFGWGKFGIWLITWVGGLAGFWALGGF